MKRIEALKQLAFTRGVSDGLLISNEINLLYFTGFLGATCLLIPKDGESTIYVQGVNYEQAKAEGKGFKVELVKRNENWMEKIAGQVKTLNIKKIAADTLSFENYHNLTKKLGGEARLRMQGNLVGELRKVKDEKELELMRKAGELTSEGMKAAYEVVRPGIKEYEAAAEIEYAMRKKGSWGTAFDTIVASGVRSAFPHGGCTDHEIRGGDLIVVDIGATYQFYHSDMTRTLVAGKPSEKQKELYEIVRSAQEKAFKAIKSKAKAEEVDAMARQSIAESGYGEYFVHGLGHGVGLEVHEPPTLSPESKDKLMIGNVVTNEPGVYMVGFGGVRLEDTALVQEHGCKILTKGPYTLEAGQ